MSINAKEQSLKMALVTSNSRALPLATAVPDFALWARLSGQERALSSLG